VLLSVCCGTMGWQKKMERARRLHRPKLKDWEQDGLCETFPSFARELGRMENYQRFVLDNDSQQEQHSIPAVLDGSSLTRQKFYQYEINNIPCVIRGIPSGFEGGKATTPWPAEELWSIDALEENSKFQDRLLKCGEDDNGKNIKIRLKDFLQYTRQNCDDSPLYVFDSGFDEDKRDRLLDYYRVPTYFNDDLFELVSEKRRAPYRWWLIGPERSGTCVHIDPLATSAWNTVITGQKRWVIFPPHVAKRIVKGKGLVRDDEDDEAIHYFMNILPRIKRKAQSLSSQPEYKNFQCYEFIQNAGETVFIPNGWWHAVLNLTHTVAITQNFASPRNFDAVWLETRTERKMMAWKWLGQLEQDYPALAERAKAMNHRDKFVMKYDPVEIKRREMEERKRKEERRRRKQKVQKVEIPLHKVEIPSQQFTWSRNNGTNHAGSSRSTPALDQERSFERSQVDRSTVVSP
jgi:histone arginine demethylase JMJD6